MRKIYKFSFLFLTQTCEIIGYQYQPSEAGNCRFSTLAVKNPHCAFVNALFQSMNGQHFCSVAVARRTNPDGIMFFPMTERADSTLSFLFYYGCPLWTVPVVAAAEH